jgi:hypothetical protein
MTRVPIWATAFMFVAGASLAAPSLEDPARVPRSERLTPSGDQSLQELVRPVEGEMAAAEGVQIARKGRGGGGKRGGSKRKNRGGFKSGNKRNALRGGEPGRPGRVGDPGGIRGGRVGGVGRVGDPGGIRGGRDVDIDRNVDIDRDVDIHGGYGYDDDDDGNELGAALLGGVVGMGIGSLLTERSYDE